MRFALCAMRFLDRAYSIAMTACKAGSVVSGSLQFTPPAL